jgi:hypothetical protein
MPTQVQFRRGNTAQTAVFTGAVAEITVDTEQKTIVVHDGVTLGGNYLSTKAFTQQVYDYANTIAGGAATDNVARALAQNAYNTANGANGLAQGAYNQANTNSGAITIIQGVDSTQNTRLGSIETINTDQNTSISIIQGVDSTQNTQIQGLQGVDLATNSAISIIQGVDLGQNTTITAVNQFAQAAYNTANSKFNSSGGTISGDVSVTGNLTVTGETFYANVTNLNVDDSFIVLNANTVGSPVFNSGIEIDRGTSNNTLLFWNESNKSWNYTDDESNEYIIASESYVANSITPVNQFTQSAFNTANSANVLAQTAFDGVDAVNGYAVSAFATANGANGLASGAFNKANTSLQNSGTQTLNGNLIVNGSVNTTEWSNTANAYVSNKLYAGIAPYLSTILPDLIAQFAGNTENYVQVNAENINPEGSADFVITADVGTDTTFYIDMGLHNSNREFGATYPLDGYLLVQGNTGQIGGNLIIGTTSQTPGQHTKIVAGGGEESNVVIQFNDDLSTIFYGNATPFTDNTQYLGSSTNRWHSLYVGPGSVNIDNIVLSNNNGKLVIAGASDIVISGSSVPSTSDISSKANNAYDKANAAFDSSNAVNGYAVSAFATANGANGLANGAYAQANTNAINISITNGVDATQNTRLNSIETVNVDQNTAISIIQGVDAGQNTTITAVNQFTQSAYDTANATNGFAASAFNKANSANVLAQTAFDSSNAVNGYAVSAFATANGANGLANGAYAAANTAYSYATQIQVIADAAYLKANAAFNSSNLVNQFAQSAFNTANGANGLAAGAFNQANTNAGAITIIQGVNATQNTRIDGLEGVDLAQNSAITIIQGVDSTQNTNITAVNTFAQSAYDKANSANVLAQTAFDAANTKFSSSGGNINGSVTITSNNNLTVTGSLFVLGNTTSFGTQTLEVVDPMILLATGNYTTDLLDIGFAGSYNDGANAHTGLFRDAPGNKEWYFFEGYTPEVSGNNNINVADASFRTSNVNVNYLKGNLIATTAVVGEVNIRDVQNTQNTNITAVNNYAVSAFNQANTNATNISITNGVDATQNTRLNSIETVDIAQNSAISIIQGVDSTQNTNITAVNNFAAEAFAQANTANTRAFSTVLKSGDTMSGSLTGVTTLGVTTIQFAQTDATTNTFTTVSTAQVSVDAWPTATYRSAKYFVQITSGSAYHIIELNLVHNGTTVFLAQYGEVLTGASLGTFDADISGDTVRLLFTGANAVSTVRVLRTVMDV